MRCTPAICHVIAEPFDPPRGEIDRRYHPTNYRGRSGAAAELSALFSEIGNLHPFDRQAGLNWE